MRAQGWRWSAGAGGALLAATLVLVAPGLAQDEDKGATEKAPPAASEQQAKASEPAQPEERPTATPAKAAPKGSLAAAAARIHLRRPPDEGEGGVVISDQNLRQMAAEGTVSEGGGVGGSVVTGDKPAAGEQGGAVNPASALVGEYLQQKRTVDGLEERLKNFDQQLAKPASDPHFAQSQNSPQFRAPGVVDRAQKQRDDLAKQLAEERAKLDGIRERARRDGVELAAPAKPAPTPAP